MAKGPQSATVLAYERIRAHLVEGELPPGSPLREEELADAVGVSRTPVREALRRLDAEGLVDLIPRRGARVASWSEAELEEVFGLRLRLEGYGARLAANRADGASVAGLAQLAAEVEEAAAFPDDDRFDRIADANNAFHGAVLAASGNDRLRRTVAAVVQLSLVRHTFRRYRPQDLRRSLGHHAELVDAIAAGDPDWAESVMRSHIFAARRSLAIDRGASGEQAPGPEGELA